MKLLFMLMLVALSVGFTSCDKDDDKNDGIKWALKDNILMLDDDAVEKKTVTVKYRIMVSAKSIY